MSASTPAGGGPLADAYRAWRRANITFTARMDAAMKGDPIDWAQIDQEVAELAQLQRTFLDGFRKSSGAAAPPRKNRK